MVCSLSKLSSVGGKNKTGNKSSCITVM
uniref:Uncharacterized protein n=1 Tax=Anguilla anguilla TaxID=7936 RepID=A0A0E9R955_ANGAN